MNISAACGGIIGLFMGFSVLSGAELIYFFTLRMWVDHSRAKKNKKRLEIPIYWHLYGSMQTRHIKTFMAFVKLGASCFCDS